MKKLILFLILAVYVSVGYSQISSDEIEDKVKAFVTDTSSNDYWKNVYEEFKESEESASSEDFLLFYYSNGVKDIKSRPFPSVYLNQNRLKMIEYSNRNKLKKVKTIGLDLIEINPFDIGTLIYLSMSIDKLENNTDNKYYKRMKSILDVIFSTGDGLTPETAIKISEIDDDEVLIGFTGFNGIKMGEKEIDGKYLSVWQNQIGDKMYFEYVFLFF